MTSERIEVQRTIRADPASIFAVLCDPQGHVAIDGSGMLMGADGELVTATGDEFVVHMDREALGDLPMGQYDVTVTIKNLCSPTRNSMDHPRNCSASDRARLRISDRAGRRRPQFPRDLVLRLV